MDLARYRNNGPQDDASQINGDIDITGVDQFSLPDQLAPGMVQDAVNFDFNNQTTRGGAVCLPGLGSSPFGWSWTGVTTSDATFAWSKVAYGYGIYCASRTSGSNTGGIAWSADYGSTWNLVSLNAAPSVTAAGSYLAIAYGNGKFVTVGYDYASKGIFAYANQSNLTVSSWTGGQIASEAVAYQGIAYGNGIWVAVGTGGRIAKTTDLTTWTAFTNSVTTSALNCISYINGAFYVGTDTGDIIYSVDGTTWTLKSNVSFASYDIRNLSYGNGVFVAVGYTPFAGNPRVYYSTDAVTWSGATLPSPNPSIIDAIAFGNGVFVITSRTTASFVSTDGANWLSVTTSRGMNGVAFGDRFIGVGSDLTRQAQIGYFGKTVFATGVYSDPNDAGSQWIMMVGRNSVGFYQNGKSPRTVNYATGITVSEQSTVVQCNNQVYIFRGTTQTPLYWTGNWAISFDVAPTPTPATGFQIIPNSNQATYYQNRLWVKQGKDDIAASDVLDFTTYDLTSNDFNLNTGDSDYIVTSYPFGDVALIVFKNKSIIALNYVSGSLTDVVASEITRQVGVIGINCVCSVGSDLVYVSNGNINLLSLTQTNNALQHKTRPLSYQIKNIMRRVNWNAANKISMAYWDNKLYVALPLDNSDSCNGIVVYNFVTETWYGEWSFSTAINMQVIGWATVDYLGLQRLHAVSEDGRIYVMEEGSYDISGAVVSDIPVSLTTRAYMFDNGEIYQRRMFADVATVRPNLSIDVFTEGVSEVSSILSNQTYSRSQSWLYKDSAYDLTNANDDYNRPYRKDYSSGPASIQPKSGFLPEAAQKVRIPLICRRAGRLSWIEFTNTQGFFQLFSVGVEARDGQSANYIQV